MFTSPIDRRWYDERDWTERLATRSGVIALLAAVRRADVADHLSATLEEVVSDTVDEALIVHQLHLDGRYPDVTINHPRSGVLAVIEAQRHRADDKHIAKLAAHYVPESGARLGILIAEAWDPRHARHPAWAVCPAPVIVMVAHDALHEVDYRPVWVHHPPSADTDVP